MRVCCTQCTFFHVLDSFVEFPTKTTAASVSHLVSSVLSCCFSLQSPRRGGQAVLDTLI